MAFRSVHHILGSLENQESWQGRRQFQQILAGWEQIVGSVVAVQTRPLGIQRQVLQVATSSAVWAQNLAFERQRILKKLNAQLGLSLIDIRFSTAQWINDRPPANVLELESWWQEHPSYVRQVMLTVSPKVEIASPEQAFQGWAESMRQRSQHLPLCPVCRCPTPQGELQRWAVCGLCIVKRW